jgi:ribosome-binding protein aMBF1 (putative translation factor)
MTDTGRIAHNKVAAGCSPIGGTARDARTRRAARDPEYAREWDAQAVAREIAWQLVKFRMDKGLTQQELAALVQTSHSQISRLESGQHLPSVATLGKIATALHLRLSITLGAWDDVTSGSAVAAD